MSNRFILGKIVKAANLEDAKELFTNRKELGIGGVIFKPNIYVPHWSHDIRVQLSKRGMNIHPDTSEVIVRSKDDFNHKKIAGNVATRLFRISKEFNAANRPCRVMFVENDELNLAVHRDVIARDGFLHLHWLGSGMICLNPVGDEPVAAMTKDDEHKKFDHGDIRRLFAAGKIDAVALEAKQAIIFDDTMVHMSGQGPRFRILAMR